jgi:hypothetical protein
MSLPRGQTLLDTSITMFFPSRLLCLKMTGASLTLTQCTPWVLVIIDPCPCGFASDFKCLSSSVLPSHGCQSWPHTEACFCPLVWLDLDDRWSTHQICSLHFINTCYNIQKYAEIYIAHMLCLHRVLKTIIFYRGLQFVARFWSNCTCPLGLTWFIVQSITRRWMVKLRE